MAGVVVEMSADEAKLWRAQAKILKQQKEMSKEYRSVQRSAQNAGQAGERSAKRTTGSVNKLIGRLGVVSVTLGAVAKGFKFMADEAERGLRSIESVETGRKGLMQLAANQAEFRRMTSRADKAAMQVGISRQEAADLLFSAHSEGFAGSFENVAKMTPFVKDINAAGTIAGQVPAMFGGKVSSAEALNATLTAAKSSRLDFGQFARALPGAAAGTSLTGSSLAETEALLSAVASRTKSADNAADALATLGSALSKFEQFQSGGVIAAVEKLQSDPELRAKTVTGDSVRKAYNFVADDLATIKQRRAEIEASIASTGTAASPINTRLAIAGRDPATAALMEKRRAANRRDIALEAEGLRLARAEAAVDRSAAAAVGSNPIERGGRAATTFIGKHLATGLGLSSKNMDVVSDVGAGMSLVGIPGVVRGGLAARNKANEAAEQLARAEVRRREAILEALDSHEAAIRAKAQQSAAEFNRDRRSAPAIRVKQRQAAGVE